MNVPDNLSYEFVKDMINFDDDDRTNRHADKFSEDSSINGDDDDDYRAGKDINKNHHDN